MRQKADLVVVNPPTIHKADHDILLFFICYAISMARADGGVVVMWIPHKFWLPAVKYMLQQMPLEILNNGNHLKGHALPPPRQHEWYREQGQTGLITMACIAVVRTAPITLERLTYLHDWILRAKMSSDASPKALLKLCGYLCPMDKNTLVVNRTRVTGRAKGDYLSSIMRLVRLEIALSRQPPRDPGNLHWEFRKYQLGQLDDYLPTEGNKPYFPRPIQGHENDPVINCVTEPPSREAVYEHCYVLSPDNRIKRLIQTVQDHISSFPELERNFHKVGLSYVTDYLRLRRHGYVLQIVPNATWNKDSEEPMFTWVMNDNSQKEIATAPKSIPIGNSEAPSEVSAT